MSLEKLIKSAKALTSRLDSGKDFPTKYVAGILSKEADLNPSDILINTMRDIVIKRSSVQNFISQKEIGQLYGTLVNSCGGENATVFKSKMAGLLLPHEKEPVELKRANASHIRGGEQHVKTLQEYDTGLEKMADEFAGVFSLNKKSAFSGYSNDTGSRAEKFAKVQLDSFRIFPKNLKVVAENEHFILCRASFETKSFREVSIDIPVQVSGGVPKLPDHFISDNGLEKLSKENVLVALKSKEEGKKFDARSRFAEERPTDSIKVENVTAPKELSYLTDIEDRIIVSSSKYTFDQVNGARGVLNRELSSAGITCQLKVANINDKGVIFSSKIGNNSFEFPVEFSNGRPLMPSIFITSNSKYDFNSSNIRKVAGNQITKEASRINLSKQSYNNMSYHQLMNEMICSVSDKNFMGAEDALLSIQNKFDDTQIVHAVQKYASLLKTAGMNEEKETMIKQAVQRGDLIRTPTSLDLYSPRFGLPLSKLAFDEDGRLTPLFRISQAKNQKDSEVLGISSYQIKLT